MRVSITSLRTFKACRREYELKYIEKVSPVATAPALIVGSSYHEKLETLYKTGEIDTSDLSKESAMAVAYQKYIYPKFKVVSAETWFEKDVLSDVLVGKIDAITDDGQIVEHKTTSGEITEEYKFSLQWDEQILAYMFATGARKVWYTVCRKPTIRQKRGESDEEFFERMVSWYDEDTQSKIRLLEITRTDEDIANFELDLRRMIQELHYTKEVSGNFYRNTANCNRFCRRCDYSPICLSYDPEQEYVGFVRRDEP